VVAKLHGFAVTLLKLALATGIFELLLRFCLVASGSQARLH
jgi:hypothetical protein